MIDDSVMIVKINLLNTYYLQRDMQGEMQLWTCFTKRLKKAFLE